MRVSNGEVFRRANTETIRELSSKGKKVDMDRARAAHGQQLPPSPIRRKGTDNDDDDEKFLKYSVLAHR